MTRILVLVGVALLAAGCGHSGSDHPKPSAVVELQYTPARPQFALPGTERATAAAVASVYTRLR